MHLGLYCPDRLPVRGYGGTQRVAVWLARGLAQLGHRVTVLAAVGSQLPEGTLVPVDVATMRRTPDLRPVLPRGLDALLAFAEPGPLDGVVPHIRTVHGNRKPGTPSPPGTLYLSADHARRHGGHAWVHNGLDPSEFRCGPKAGHDLFLGRLHGAKGWRWAVAGARRLGRPLVVAGGWRPAFRGGVRFVGSVDGEAKVALLAGAQLLWMPAQWEEPFGLTLIEAMVSGTPVLGTRRGALPEVVGPSTGRLADTLDELVALASDAAACDPDACRAHVEARFDHLGMAADYVRMVEGQLRDGRLPPGRPRGTALSPPPSPPA